MPSPNPVDGRLGSLRGRFGDPTLGYAIGPTLATPSPSIPTRDSYRKLVYLGWLSLSSHFSRVAAKAKRSTLARLA
jgi:hypothetical protein